MSFQFVDNKSLDAVTRKRIRSHVMRGKNVGKTRVTRSKATTGRIISTFPHPNQRLEGPFVSQNSCDQIAIVPPRGDILNLMQSPAKSISHEMSMWPWTTRIDTQSQGIVHNFLHILNYALYPSSVCVRPNISKLIWFEFLFKDEAFLHAALALSETFATAMAGRTDDSVLAIHHLTRTFRLLSQNIATHGSSDLIIATVLYIFLGERMKGQFERGQIHVRVLKKMVSLRGGIQEVLKIQPLAQKILLADIESAVHDGTSTHFNVTDIPGREILEDLRERILPVRNQTTDSRITVPLSIETRELFSHLRTLADYSEAHNEIPRLSSAHFCDILTYLNYKILSLDPMRVLSLHDIFDSLYQLSAQSFMISFWHTPCFRHQPFQLLQNRLMSAIDMTFKLEVTDHAFILWTLFIGACSVFRNFEDPWLKGTIVHLLHKLKIMSWEELVKTLYRFPFIMVFHAKPAMRLWKAVDSRIDYPRSH